MEEERTFWLSVRSDGREVVPQTPVRCVETSRGNGIVTYKAIEVVHFPPCEGPLDFTAHLTVSSTATEVPFAWGANPWRQEAPEGAVLHLTGLTFEEIQAYLWS